MNPQHAADAHARLVDVLQRLEQVLAAINERLQQQPERPVIESGGIGFQAELAQPAYEARPQVDLRLARLPVAKSLEGLVD